jgi:hypothetical protein
LRKIKILFTLFFHQKKEACMVAVSNARREIGIFTPVLHNQEGPSRVATATRGIFERVQTTVKWAWNVTTKIVSGLWNNIILVFNQVLRWISPALADRVTAVACWCLLKWNSFWSEQREADLVAEKKELSKRVVVLEGRVERTLSAAKTAKGQLTSLQKENATLKAQLATAKAAEARALRMADLAKDQVAEKLRNAEVNKEELDLLRQRLDVAEAMVRTYETTNASPAKKVVPITRPWSPPMSLNGLGHKVKGGS